MLPCPSPHSRYPSQRPRCSSHLSSRLVESPEWPLEPCRAAWLLPCCPHRRRPHPDCSRARFPVPRYSPQEKPPRPESPESPVAMKFPRMAKPPNCYSESRRRPMNCPKHPAPFPHSAVARQQASSFQAAPITLHVASASTQTQLPAPKPQESRKSFPRRRALALRHLRANNRGFRNSAPDVTHAPDSPCVPSRTRAG